MEAKAIIRYLLPIIFLFVYNEQVRSSALERNLYGFTTLIRPHAHNGRLTYLDAIPSSGNPLVPAYPQAAGEQSSDVPIDSSETIVANEHSVPYELDPGDNVGTNDDRDVAEDDPAGPQEHAIPYSEHEIPKDVPTRPKHTVPGEWAKPPSERKIPLDFVPTKMYAQVRGTHTVKRLPRRKAIDAAATEEERANAPRLRAVVTNSKVNTIYTEEGYEDSAYDHAGQARDADFHEGYARKLHDQANSGPGLSGSTAGVSDKGTTRTRLRKPEPEEFDEYADDYRYHLEEEEKTKSGYKQPWKRPDLDPKVLTENGIDRLEEDLKKEAEEVETGSENYESRNDHDYEDTNDRPVEVMKRKTRTRLKKKMKKRLRNDSRNAIDGVDESSSETQRSPETKDDFYNEETPKSANLRFDQRSVVPRVVEKHEGTTLGFVENAQTLTSPRYVHDSNEPLYNVPVKTQVYNLTSTHDTSTVSYDDLKEKFWSLINSKENLPAVPLVYVHEQTTIPRPMVFHEATTLRPQSTPVALATINGHGPYLLVTDNQVTTEIPSSIEAEVTRPVNLADVQRVAHSETTIRQNDHWQPGQDVNPIYPSTFAPYIRTDPARLRLSVYETWRPNEAGEVPLVATEPSASGFHDNFAFTGSVIPLPATDVEAARKPEDGTKYESNPFLNPEARATYANVLDQRKAEFEVQQTTNDGKVNVEATSTNLDYNDKKKKMKKKNKKKNDEEMTFFRFAPNTKYNKVLNYIKKQRNAQSVDEFMRTRQSSDFNGRKNESNVRDFTVAKPSALGEITYSDFLLNPYGNVVGVRSSVSQESETSQKIGRHRPTENQKQHRRYRAQAFKDAISESPSTQGDGSFGWNSHLATWLLPPAPNSRDEYQDASNEYYRMSRYADPRYTRNFRQATSYSSNPEDQTFYSSNRRIRARRKRSSRASKDVVVAYGAKRRFDRSTLKDEMLMNVGQAKDRGAKIIEGRRARSKRSLLSERVQEYAIAKMANLQLARKPREGRDRRNEKLLDESPRIAGGVIDEEIKERFGDKNQSKGEDVEEKERDQVEIEVPELDYSEDLEDVNDVDVVTTTKATVDLKKYPFYKNENVPSTSALKYVVNSRYVPKKTLGGMEFYESRNVYMDCDEVNPNLEHVVPDDEEPVPNRGPKKDLPRLRGLGDKLDCFKAKYFDENPLDNPLFFERNVSQPTPPTELDPRKFASKLFQLPEENHQYIVQKLSKKTEDTEPGRRRSKTGLRIYRSRDTVPVKYAAKAGEGNNVSAKVPGRNYSGGSLTKSPGNTARNRRHRVTRKSTTTTTEVPVRDSTNPYQKQVYDDVIGTIKNLASLQETFYAQTIVPLMEPPTTAPPRLVSASSVDATSFSYVPNSLRERGTGFPLVDITKSSHDAKIEGLVPPLLPRRITKNVKIVPYKTDKVSYRTRARTEGIPGDRKIVDYYRTVTVHKRSVNDAEEPEGTNKMDSGRRLNQRFVNVLGSDLQAEESKRISRRVNSEATSTTQKPLRRRRKPGTLTTPGATAATIAASTGADESKSNNGQKTVYTVRGRTRHSRNKEDVGKNGKFTAEQKASDITDVRRKEPRYSQIRRRKGTSVSSVTEVSPSIEIIVAADNATPSSIESAVTTAIVEPEKNRTVDEQSQAELYQAARTAEQTKNFGETDNFAGRSDVKSEKIDIENGGKPKGRVKKYDVRENVQESTTTSTGTDESRDSEENSKAYLRIDPSGYADAFADVSTESSLNGEDTRNTYDNKKWKSDRVRENKNDKSDKSEEDETSALKKSRSYKDSDEDRSDDSKEITEEKDGEKEFFRYTSRPNSPAESFEDERYSELGPRINKPAFHHPPFERQSNEKHRSSDNVEDESEEDDDEEDSAEDSEGKERYVFPWSRDVEDEKEESKYISAYGRFEYPWEKRERLAKERKKKKDRENYGERSKYEYYGDDGDDDDDDDDDGRTSSSTDHHERYVYPWERYDVPTKNRANDGKNFWRSSIFDDDEPLSSNIYERFVYPWDRYEVPSKRHNFKHSIRKSSIFDNDEMASEYRPVAKFSSKYSSSKFKMPLDSDPVVISTVDSDKARESIVSFVNEEPVATTMNYPIVVSTTTSATQTTLVPTISAKVSNARFIPENVTTVPRKQNREKMTLKSGRTRLRTTLRNTTKPIETLKRTSEAALVDPARKQIRSRVRATKNNLIRSESQVATSTVKTVEQSSPATRSIETTSSSPAKSVEKILTRRRGNTTRAIPKTLKSEVSSSRVSRTKANRNNPKKQVANTQGTKSSRRRIRPLSSGIAVTSTTIRKKHQGLDKPSIVDSSDRTISKKAKRRDDDVDDDDNDNNDNHDHDDSDDDVHRKFEDSTPTSRTVEHHSRVSKEEIITKTFYPEDVMYELRKDKGLLKNANSKVEHNAKDHLPITKQPKKTFFENEQRSTKKSAEANPIKNEHVEKVSIITKETPDHVYQTKEIDKDGVRGMYISITPNNNNSNDNNNDSNDTKRSSLLEKELDLKNVEMEELERRMEAFSTFDKIDQQQTDRDGTDDVTGSVLSSDSYVVENLLRKAPLRTIGAEETDDNKSEDRSRLNVNGYGTEVVQKERDEEKREKNRWNKEKKPSVNFIKEPDRRLYYYVQNRK